jgi:bacteriocin biosynthesis cyclodehydratase domain-containing protein
MLENPRLKNCYNIGLIEEDKAILIAENSEKIVEGGLLCALLGLVEDGRSSDDIADALSDRFGLAEVYYGLAELERLGLTEEANRQQTPDEVFWGLMGTRSVTNIDAGSDSRIAVTSTVEETWPLVDTLRRSGLHGVRQTSLIEPIPEDRMLTVVVTQDYLDERLSEWNTRALNKSHQWILCKPSGIRPWIGPLFVPGETGCWRCLEERLRYNRELEEFIRFKTGRWNPPLFPVGVTAGSKGFAEGILATAIGTVLSGEEPDSLKGRILTFDWKTMEFTAHEMVRLPHCPECGAGSVTAESNPEPPFFTSRKKRYRQDGGHRIFSPEVTLERHSHLISQITGIVSPLVSTTTSSLKEVESADPTLMRLYSANHASIGKVRKLEDVKKRIRSGASSGKGMTDIQAKTSCLCEAIERVSGIYRGTEPKHRAKYEEVRENAFHPHDLLQYSEKQYSERERWREFNCPFTIVFPPFDESRAIDWSPVWSITHKEWKQMPTAFLYYGYWQETDQVFCRADSNGNAAGNCLEEAVLQGLLELIERDAVALWWYNMIPKPAVDLDQIQDPMIVQFVETVNAIGRKVWVLDLTSDLGVPVFAAFSYESTDGPDRPIFGFGAHLDAKTAFTRALSEMTQSLAITDFPPEFLDAEDKLSLHREFTEQTKLGEWPYLLPAENSPLKRLTDYPDQSSDDLLDDVTLCVDILDKLGLEVLVNDQTRPDLGLSVVKVIVPGLRHFWARYAPGRLYEVPVRMGWLDTPRAEEDLNPTPIFF